MRTNFILDVYGALFDFGDWGQPSGMSMSENSLRSKMVFDQKYGMLMKDMDFEVEYQPSSEEEKNIFLKNVQ